MNWDSPVLCYIKLQKLVRLGRCPYASKREKKNIFRGKSWAFPEFCCLCLFYSFEFIVRIGSKWATENPPQKMKIKFKSFFIRLRMAMPLKPNAHFVGAVIFNRSPVIVLTPQYLLRHRLRYISITLLFLNSLAVIPMSFRLGSSFCGERKEIVK